MASSWWGEGPQISRRSCVSSFKCPFKNRFLLVSKQRQENASAHQSVTLLSFHSWDTTMGEGPGFILIQEPCDDPKHFPGFPLSYTEEQIAPPNKQKAAYYKLGSEAA